MAQYGLTEIDALEFTVIVNDELDYFSPSPNPAVIQPGRMSAAPLTQLGADDPRAASGTKLAVAMDHLCCGALGLSIMITATKGDKKHVLLFDTGPEEDVWERNATRLRLDLATIEHIHLSHWHRDHSGGMVRAVRLITGAKAAAGASAADAGVTVDLQPNRPYFRGLKTPAGIISLEADPTFEEIEGAGATVVKTTEVHTILDDFFLVSGAIPRKTAYETGIPGGMRLNQEAGAWEEDPLILDERFVACNIKGKGLVVFTGCSHAGVVNVTRHARELGGETPLYCIAGGFHLADGTDEKRQSTMADLTELEPKLLMPGHCTGWKFKQLADRTMPDSMVPLFGGTKYALN